MTVQAPIERVPARVGALIGTSCGALVALIWLLGGLAGLDLRFHDLR